MTMPSLPVAACSTEARFLCFFALLLKEISSVLLQIRRQIRRQTVGKNWRPSQLSINLASNV
jgi:hypothetical protein